MRKKTALVIGGLKGIGQAISSGLAAQGFVTYATSRDSHEGEEAGIVPLRMDVTNETEVNSVFQLIQEKHDSLDVLVNNAGISLPGPFQEADEKDWEAVFKTNVFGPFLCTKKAFPLMEKAGGRIINISSIMTKRPLSQQSIYTSSKQALEGMGKVLAEEWYRYGIMTTNINLGATYTDLWKGVEGFSSDDMLSVNDVARVVSFIATTPLHVRIDDLTLTPPKGVL
ncbi:SDR family oxidoreductase [Paenibacillus abyssi]|uniref:3-oxoacyl-ACP reductase n=1 Tax=Paenibacillus abyssi TaxID=1340531 RepID=A0A917CGP1_9BACL|nr:SDR family oxidoreductase [Paenibacillus abyssi]GGF87231.1 3-oxoacyl-ACP reductase [Paenibacillus abyssi]